MDDVKVPGGFSTTSLPLPTHHSDAPSTKQTPPATDHKQAVSIGVISSDEASSSSTALGQVAAEASPAFPEEDADSASRGRTMDPDTASDPSPRQHRGTSMPASARDSMDDEADQGLHLPNKKDSGRSLASSSLRRGTHSFSQSANIASSLPATPPISTASTFNPASSTVSSDSKASSGTFMESLKLRTAAAVTAAEASNPKAVAQARETLQKWGAQWAGFKKNIAEAREGRPSSISSSPAASQFSINTPSETTEDTKKAALGSSISKGFDEMRRTVAERRQREDRDRVVSDVGTSGPLDVPLDSKSKRRDSAGPILSTNSEPETVAPQSSQTAGPTSSIPSRPGRSDSIGAAAAVTDQQESSVTRFVQPPAAKTVPTVVETLMDASPSSHATESSGTPAEHRNKTPAPPSPASAGFKAAPIIAQPSYSAMSMVVPGINAKNRNEVMSIGFSPPVVTPPVPPKEEGGLGTKLQGIGNIGNIYRFLNRGSAEATDGNPSTGALNAAPIQQLEEHVQYAKVNEEEVRGPIGNPPTPRRTSSDAVQRADSPGMSIDGGSTSPASAALLSLVQKDELARRKSLSKRRTGSAGDHRQQGSDSSSSPPLSAGFAVPVTTAPIETELGS